MKEDSKIMLISVGVIGGVGAAIILGLLTGGVKASPDEVQYAPLTEPTCDQVVI